MISDIDGSTMSFGDGRFLLVTAEERERVECVLKTCGCAGEWTVSVSSVTGYSEGNNELNGVSVWTLFVESYEDVKKVQAALDEQN